MQDYEIAYAKINLALHVRARRPDGYHELETLFAFVDNGDVIGLEPAEHFSLELVGGSDLSTGPDNLVSKAAAMMNADNVALSLDKQLPVAAGLGGGSADAAAAIRLIDRWRTGGDGSAWTRRAAALGADVPACVRSGTCIGRGTGTVLEPFSAPDIAATPVLLVNPGLPLATGPVFAVWDGIDQGPLPQGSALDIAHQGRNDLEIPAIRLCPPIADVLAALRTQNPIIARMSGSGATCFALFDSEAARDAAALAIGAQYPDWWLMTGKLR